MTITATPPTETTGAKDPKDLISPELFGKLVGRVQEEMPVTTSYAESVVAQALAFLAAVAHNPADSKLTPSAAVDPGWHAFVEHTREYAAFCRHLTGGGFIHHIPVKEGTTLPGKSLAHTREAIAAAGYQVDERMWEADASCGSTTNCDFLVEMG